MPNSKVPASLLLHRRSLKRLVANDELDSNFLLVDAFTPWSFQRAAKEAGELRPQYSTLTKLSSANSRDAEFYTVSLPGFTASQARYFAATVERQQSYEDFLSTLEAGNLEVMLKLALRYSKELPGLVELTPVEIESRQWELRAVQWKVFRKFSASDQSTFTNAYTRDQVLRFLYKKAGATEYMTYRVRLRSVYGVEGVPTFFRGEYGGRIRSYSVARCSEIFVESLSAKYLLPTLAVEIELNHRLEKLFTRVVQKQ